MRSVGTLIFERPRPLSRQRRANHLYTLICEEPLLLSEVERGGPVVDLAIPSFCVSEVSEDDRFRNEYLAHKPFGTWADKYRDELDRRGPTFVNTLGQNQFEGG